MSVNNTFYDTLGARWYEANDDPVALLRAEGRLKNPWVENRIRHNFNSITQINQLRILDVGCGAGFLANSLSEAKFKVVGVDLAYGALQVAKQQDKIGTTCFALADAYRLPFPDQCFDVVTSMDFLEHVENPEQVIAEISRVLKSNGLFFFHTFNRNLLAWFVVIKGVEWFVKNTPKHMHVLPLFIKPEELMNYGRQQGLETLEVKGIMPDISKWAFWKLLLTREVPREFSFRFTPSLTISYLGYAKKLVST